MTASAPATTGFKSSCVTSADSHVTFSSRPVGTRRATPVIPVTEGSTASALTRLLPIFPVAPKMTTRMSSTTPDLSPRNFQGAWLPPRVGSVDQFSGSTRSLLDDIERLVPLHHVFDVFDLVARLDDEPGRVRPNELVIIDPDGDRLRTATCAALADEIELLRIRAAQRLPLLVQFTKERLIRGDPDFPLGHDTTIPEPRRGQTGHEALSACQEVTRRPSPARRSVAVTPGTPARSQPATAV